MTEEPKRPGKLGRAQNEPPEDNPGIACPRCGCGHMPAVWTRRVENRNIRKRKCRNCGHECRCSEKIDANEA